MFLTYIDETGDEGYPGLSELFVLTSIYMHYKDWRDNFLKIQQLRRELRDLYGLPVHVELHVRELIANKGFFKDHLKLRKAEKVDIIYRLFRVIAQMDARIVNVAINKKRVADPEYDIFERAVTYSIQRLENDLTKNSLSDTFMLIVDEGRTSKMRKVCRELQRYNYIPSRVEPGTTYRREIARMIEDPLPKSSEESYFIQIADCVSYIVYLYTQKKFNSTPWGKNVEHIFTDRNVEDLLKAIRDNLNVMASLENVYGIVHYPKDGQKNSSVID